MRTKTCTPCGTLSSAGRMEGTAGVTDGGSWLENCTQDGVSTPPISQEGTLRQLLNILINHEDRDAAIAAAFYAVTSLQQQEQAGNEYGSADSQQPDTNLSNPSLPLRRAASEKCNDPPASTSLSNMLFESTERGRTAVRSGPAFALADFPGCKRLVDAYRKIFRIPNKTPLSVLYEYSSRMNLTLVFEEMQDGSGPGPLVVQTMLRDADGESLYRPGIGTARSKKDAKQLAAAALLELLLETVPFQDLLYKSEKQQLLKNLQVSRMRWPSMGRGRGPAMRPSTGQGGLPPLFGSAMIAGGAFSVLPGPIHDGLPAAPGVSNRCLSTPTLVQGGPAMFTTPSSQHGGHRAGGMQGQSIPYQQPGALVGATSVGAPGRPLHYLSSGAPQGGDLHQIAAGFGMHRDVHMGDGFGACEAGPGVFAVGTGGGTASKLVASMAIMSFNASQQQQQQLMDAGSPGMLQQGYGPQGFTPLQGAVTGDYSEGVYLDLQVPYSVATLEDPLQQWPNRGHGYF